MKNTLQQAAQAIMMIKPIKFGYNQQTAGSNAFQQNGTEVPLHIQQKALQEFNHCVNLLESQGIKVIIFKDTPKPHTPDSIFPNNWISFHDDGTVITYPMMAPNRRLERRGDIITALEKKYQFNIKRVLDLSEYERNHKYLEGTGSIVFDYINGVMYANISARSDQSLLKEVSKTLKYELVSFKAVDRNQMDIYHTNVLMCIGDAFAVICLEAIPDQSDRDKVVQKLEESHHQIIAIDYSQLYAFAGNMIQLRNEKGEKFLVLSQTAYDSLEKSQIDELAVFARLLPVNIPTIEKYGGGSIRCMIAALHLPKSNT
ncbi:MAG: citrulline utilization hydrolase CtlX [Candidatus Cyclobacteriaceae bacterium M3_2C_046]